jgi:hypothetical protein
MSTSALTDAIYQNTRGNSQGYPAGLSWDTGVYGTSTLTPAPSGFSSLTGWGVIYPEAGAPVSANAASDTVQIANYTTYVHLTNGSWAEVQNQAQDGIGGAHYVADFSGNANVPWTEQKLSDGSVSVDAPQVGYNDHFWPGVRGTYTPGTVDGVFIEANMKTNDASANLVAQLGADWWLNSTAQYVSGFANNPVVGGSDFTKLTTQWQTLYYTSLSPQQLTADPPPGLQTASAPVTTQPVTTQPVTTQPVTTQPVTTQPVTTQPVTTQPVTTQPVTTQPVTTTPVTPVATTPPPVTQPPATHPSVTGFVASPSTGTEFPGDRISLTLKFNEAVTVSGKPTLSLNDGGTATYKSGSGTDTLTFTDTVRWSDKDVSALAVTAVNLPNHAVIKDAAGTAADLSGALKTFSGLKIDPPTSVAPTVSIKDPSLSVPANGKIDLGLSLTAPDSATASVTITGLPRYETITDNLDHKTFHGNSITLSEAEVNSGLTLQSNSWHSGHPATTLTVTAHDSTAGGSASSASQTISVKNVPATGSTLSSFALLNQHLAGDFNGNTGQGQITSHSSSAHDDWVLANSRH